MSLFYLQKNILFTTLDMNSQSMPFKLFKFFRAMDIRSDRNYLYNLGQDVN